MEYIPDKSLYSAVMFFLKMCPSLNRAYDYKVDIAANFYHVSSDDVLAIVRKELWEREIDKIKGEDEWHSIYHPSGSRILNIPFNSLVLVCPQCGRRFSCDSNNYSACDKLYTQRCACGFADKNQRNFIRKDAYERLKLKGEVD